ncbi:hypothetical protein NE237_009962 [Protea cynaroides]|uniref:Uncharacterized protein n=1 Tax=Protea cynaroides TaxID=273540 RepID=A0A9Q0R153_9MAGN|nr:hypothetical protein NE237_009962 [Protea cynaroides]
MAALKNPVKVDDLHSENFLRRILQDAEYDVSMKEYDISKKDMAVVDILVAMKGVGSSDPVVSHKDDQKKGAIRSCGKNEQKKRVLGRDGKRTTGEDDTIIKNDVPYMVPKRPRSARKNRHTQNTVPKRPRAETQNDDGNEEKLEPYVKVLADTMNKQANGMKILMNKHADEMKRHANVEMKRLINDATRLASFSRGRGQ